MRSYPALLGRSSGLLQIDRHTLVFTPDDPNQSSVSLSTQRLEIQIEGRNSQHYYLNDSFDPENSICVQDLNAIIDLANFGSSQAKAILEKSKNMKIRTGLIWGSPFAVALLLLLAIPFLLSLVPISWLGSALSLEQERKLGHFLFPLAKTELSISDSDPAQAGLEKLVGFLQKGTPELQAFKFEVHVSTSTAINAFALPGGILVFNRGLIAKAESADEILGVLAHEMAHVERRHSVKSLAGRLGTLGGLIILAGIVGSDAATVIGKASDMMTLKHSRDDESEADQRGFQFLQNANASTDGMIQFFKKLQSQEKGLPAALALFSTHPLSEERVEALQQIQRQTRQTGNQPLPITIQDLRQQTTPTNTDD